MTKATEFRTGVQRENMEKQRALICTRESEINRKSEYIYTSGGIYILQFDSANDLNCRNCTQGNPPGMDVIKRIHQVTSISMPVQKKEKKRENKKKTSTNSYRTSLLGLPRK